MRAANIIVNSGWVQSLGVSFLVALIACFLQGPGERRLSIVTASILALILVCAGFLVVYSNNQPPQQFSATLVNVMGGRQIDPMRSEFQRVCNTSAGEVVVPEPTALYILVRNGTALAATVGDLEIKEKMDSGEWLELTRVPWNAGRNYAVVADPSQAYEVEFSYLDERLTKSIGPGQTVEGWLFLSTPDSLQRSGTGEYQIVLTDTDGIRSTAILQFDAKKIALGLDRTYGGAMHTVGSQRNLLKLPMRAYACVPDQTVLPPE
ncbi:hypothetical protein [Terriglobus roseus]|uniref:Uncharacterized protein n=1 Tax=Terriglobus roseus TaxID=392734 RepID=A0A1H4J413_9BACT|nr:hypothetical protein [Terriglobus roseus]SEB40368.1 hypothetical protein SAMN05443244_0304 [Terriglobus roseus]